MTLVLTFHAQTQVPVEVEGITPDALRGKPLAEVEKLTIYHGNRELPLAEMFSVSGCADDGHMVFEGDLSGVHWIGAKMKAGRIDVPENAGRHLGSEMSGGEIHVGGGAGDWVGGEMHGGLIHVRGDAGHLVGAAYRGSARGMTGGTILIDGRAGNEIGHTMRRGLIAVGGAAGDLVGFNMLAGTILVFGTAGIRPAAEMRRGTIALFGENPPKLLPSFRFACRFQPPMLPLVHRHLQQLGFPVPEGFGEQPCELFHGDLVSLGRGEILLPA